MFNEIEREIHESPAYRCSFCNTFSHVGYGEPEGFYCYNCAFSFGSIDEDQFREDSNEEQNIIRTNSVSPTRDNNANIYI